MSFLETFLEGGTTYKERDDKQQFLGDSSVYSVDMNKLAQFG